jgi:hypothetical protein
MFEFISPSLSVTFGIFLCFYLRFCLFYPQSTRAILCKQQKIHTNLQQNHSFPPFFTHSFSATRFGRGFQRAGPPWEGPPRIPNPKPNFKVLNLSIESSILGGWKKRTPTIFSAHFSWGPSREGGSSS